MNAADLTSFKGTAGQETPSFPFLRSASGLKRDIGLVTGIVIALSATIGLGWQKRVFQITGRTPIRETEYFLGLHPAVMAFLITGLLMLLTVGCLAVLSAAMPRTGGGYVFISRALTPGLGFVATWLEYVANIVSIGLLSVAIIEVLFIFIDLTGIQLPAFLLSPYPLVVGGLLVLGGFALIAVCGMRVAIWIQHFQFWPAMILLIAVLGLLIIATPASMERGVQELTDGHTSEEYTQAALDQGLEEVAAENSYWRAVWNGLPYAYWTYLGFAIVTFLAGEVLRPRSYLPLILVISALLLVLVNVTTSILLVRATSSVGRLDGFSLTSAIAFLSSGGGSYWDADLPYIGGWLTVIAAGQARGMGIPAVVMLLLVLFSCMWVANDILPWLLASSRMTLAVALDRLLPSWMAYVQKPLHSPVPAVVIAALLASIGVVAEADLFGRQGIWLGDLAGEFISSVISPWGAVVATDIWSAIFLVFVSVACALLPITKRKIFRSSPFGRYPAATGLVIALGTVSAFSNLAILAVLSLFSPGYDLLGVLLDFLIYPWSLSGLLYGSMPFIFTFGLILLGIVIYAIFRLTARSRNADIGAVCQELPPE